MLLIYLLLTQVSCEWVEIYQNHNRREPPRKVTVNTGFKETTETNIIYRNQSITDHVRNKGFVDRVANVGNIQRVRIPSVKTPSIKTRSDGNKLTEHSTVSSDIFGKSKGNTNQKDVTINHHIQSSNLPPHNRNIYHGNVKRIDTGINSNREKEVIRTATVNEQVHNKGLLEDETKYVQRLHNEHRDRILTNENPQLKNRINNFNADIEDSSNLSEQHFQIISNTGEIKSPVGENTKNRPLIVTTTKRPQGTSKVKIIRKEEYMSNINNAEKEETDKQTENKVKEKAPVENHYNLSNSLNKMTSRLKLSETNNPIEEVTTSMTKLQITQFESTPAISESKVVDLSGFTHTFLSRHPENTNFPKDKKGNSNDFPADVSNVTKGNTLSGVWKLIKVVSDTIYKNTQRTFKSKIKYLEGLKTTILTSIEDQIDRAWPDDDDETDSGRSRRARSAQARGHVEFPSSEGALMTISFLTFAVFLIKLVLQVIHTYKNKTMMVTPTVVAAVGRAATALKSQH